MAGNMIAMWAISKGIELVVKHFDNLANASKHAAERAKASLIGQEIATLAAEHGITVSNSPITSGRKFAYTDEIVTICIPL